MYWIYLSIFVILVFIPDFITGGFFGLKEESTEELSIFILGSIAFVLYLIKENRLEKYRSEKASVQRDASRMSKDLTSSYSYIGEINRKLEIFKNISLGMPVWSKFPRMKRKDAFEYILASVKIITRADEYTIRFVNEEKKETLLELKSKKEINVKISIEDCLSKNKKYFETDEYMVAISPESIDGVISILTLRKKNYTNSSDDPDILKAIISQSLFLYMYSRKCSIEE